jgi:glycosyltransferase involved in cell wall biosynthesis
MERPAPLVTVIVATYRSPLTLAQALRSIQLQSFDRFETIVVADGDPEPSERVVAALDDARFRHVRLEGNSGNQATPNRAGCELARSEWIAYLGHDDLWFPWHLEQLYAGSSDDVDMLHPLAAMMAPDGVSEIIGQPLSDEARRLGWNLPPSTWLHRKSLLEVSGGWINDTTLPWAVDFDVLRRMTLAGARIRCVPRLSVLKFTSSRFGIYGPAAIRPQADYVAALVADPLALERRVLTEAAICLSRVQNTAGQPPQEGMYNGVRALWRFLRTRVSAYPRLSRWWTPVFRWRRRISRRQRGLG